MGRLVVLAGFLAGSDAYKWREVCRRSAICGLQRHTWCCGLPLLVPLPHLGALRLAPAGSDPCEQRAATLYAAKPLKL